MKRLKITLDTEYEQNVVVVVAKPLGVMASGSFQKLGVDITNPAPKLPILSLRIVVY